MMWLYIALGLLVVGVLAMVVDEVLYARKVRRMARELRGGGR
jgi:hypothetical protein